MKTSIFFLSDIQLQSSFRNDINALRAWAVLAVVFYHFGVPGFSGGFVGVDVFFVISGFLMTGIIVKGLENQNFSVLDFYFARIRRILPGLIGLCVAVLLIGWFLLAPDDYMKTAEHVQDVLLFKSNSTFSKEAGYFDALSHEKWLLHTWSLSVEWQFYIILPLLIYPVWLIKKRKKWVFILFAALALSALIACINKTSVDSAKAFYMLKYRSWEMIFGGLVYFFSEYNFPNSKKMRMLFYAGVILIIYSIVFIDAEDNWPGSLAIIPVLGASLVVFSSERNIWINRLLLFQWVGARSYSIYLWHWPIVVLLAYFQKSDSVAWILSGVVFSLFLGNISYLFIENPSRSAGRKNKVMPVILIVLISALVYFLAENVVKAGGFPMRVDTQIIQISDEQRNTVKNFRNCIYGEDRELGALSCVLGGDSIGAILIGDSHAGAVATAVQSAMPQDDAGIYVWTRAACPFIKGVTAKIRTDCDAYAPWVFDRLKSEPKNIPIVLITRSSLYVFGGGADIHP
jgi:peptidoglycan/LPS O-acetylase OafA/YrhL